MPADLAALYAAWNAQVNPADLATLQAAILQYQAVINANLATQFQAQGLPPATFDFLRTAFLPNSQGIDAVLDLITGLTITGNQINMLVGGGPFNFNGGINTAGFNIGGTASGTAGGGTGGLACDTTLFQPNSVHVATAQELTSFAGAYTGQVYTNDGTGNYVPGNGTASFSSNGALMLNGQPKTPTSICVDNASGPNGNVLYAQFADGHVDLFSDMTFSGAIDTPAGGGGAGAVNSAIGPHLAGFTFPITMANVVGTYDVAIFRVPVGQENLIGPAKLTISETGGVKAMELATPGGTVISHIDTNYPHLPPATSFQFQAGIGQIVGINGSATDNYLVVQFGAAGLLTGTAGGFSQIGFRNSLNAYNTPLPAAFAALAGTWIGPAQALTCGQPNVTVTITAAGKVTVNGEPNLSCATGTIVEATWDGNDDYIIPLSTGGYRIALDSLKGGGSASGGGIFITIPDPTNPTSITKVLTTLTGMGGAIEVNSPVKQ